MPAPDNGLFAAGSARLNDRLHGLGPTSPRGQTQKLIGLTGGRYDPESPVAYHLMKRRNPGRKLTPFAKMGNVNPALKGVPFAMDGKAYVPKAENLDYLVQEVGRPVVMNHEWEHAYAQSPDTHPSVDEIAPVMGDIVAQAQSFRRQSQKDLDGNIRVGFKNQSPEWMRGMSKQHGYFDGRSMTDLLRTPAGTSWLRQAALGPKAGSVPKEFDPLAPNRRDLPLPTAPVQLPALPDDGYTPAHIINEPSASRRANMLAGWKMMKASHRKDADNQALRDIWPAPSHQSPDATTNDYIGKVGLVEAGGNQNARTGNIGRGLEDERMQNLDPSSPIRYPDVTGHVGGNPYLEAHENTRYPGQDLNTIVPRPGGNIRSLLKPMEDNPMGGWNKRPVQGGTVPYYQQKAHVWDSLFNLFKPNSTLRG